MPGGALMAPSMTINQKGDDDRSNGSGKCDDSCEHRQERFIENCAENNADGKTKKQNQKAGRAVQTAAVVLA